MRKIPVYIILAGFLLVVTSCVPVARTAYRMMLAEPPQDFDLLPDRGGRIPLTLDHNAEIELSLLFEFAVDDPGLYGVRYTYRMTADDKVLEKQSGLIEGNVSFTETTTTEPGANPSLSQDFPVLVAGPGEVLLEIGLDEVYAQTATLVAARAELSMDPPRFKISFINAVVVWTLGTLLILSGAIQWTREIAAVPARTDSQNESERLWCVLCHLGALAGYILPFSHILVPMAIWMLKRDQLAGVDDAGRESLNFQLSVTLIVLIGLMLSAVGIGLAITFAVVVYHFCMTVFAARQVQRGIQFRYPLNIRMIKQAGAG